ncbi:MAG: P-loop NTPase, partial [Bacteroidales bacterium]|nr:P-loop NTPase [Bacteroidales bacterium]
HKYYLFGKEGLRKLAAQKNIPLLGEIPLVQGIREGGDFGHPVALDEEGISGKIFRKLAQTLVEQVDYRNSTSPPTQIVKITH